MHQHELSVMKMTLSSHNMSSDNNRSVSPTSSPRSSPRPSPKPQTKRDHSPRSEIHLSTSFKEPPLFNKNDLSPMNPFADFSLSSGRSSVNEFQTPDFNRSESTGGSSTKDNNNKKEGKSKKKTAWFSVLYPTYKSRSEDFKQTFKDAPDDERLVVDYSCALQKEILVQGRLYVSQNYLRFYANIFGWETSVSVKWKDVTAITKEKTALVIPNAVLIATRNDKFFFTSFVARDKTYLMLFRVWQNALMDRPMNQQEMWQLVHDSYGAELGLTSDDEDYIAPGTEDEKFSGRMSIESYSEECASNADGTGGNDQQMILEDSKLDDDNQSQSASDSRTNQQDLMIMNGNGNGTGGGGIIEIFQQELDVAGHSSQQMPTDFSDTTESDHDKDKTVKSLSPARCSHDPPILDPPDTPNSHEPMNHPRDPSRSSSDEKLYPVCSALHKGKQLMNEVISLHVDKLFTLLFTSSKFFLDFHEGRKTTDLKQTLWSIDAENIKSRVINLTVALNQPVGPKTAQVTEKQVMLPCSKAGFLYAIDVETVNAGIPYADSFCILVHYCIHRISDTQSSIAVYGQIKYKKSVWGLVKTMIEKNCWQGLEDFFTNLGSALVEHSKETISITVKRKSRRRRRPLSIQRPSSEEIEPRGGSRTGAAARRLSHISTSNIIVFAVLLLLIGLNFVLYYKLQSLEDDAPPYSIIDLHVLKDPPKSHDDWIKLLQKQEALHTVEMQKWQKVLRTAIKLLKQTEESLNELQRSIHPTYTNKIMSIIENHRNFGEQLPRDDDDEDATTTTMTTVTPPTVTRIYECALYVVLHKKHTHTHIYTRTSNNIIRLHYYRLYRFD